MSEQNLRWIAPCHGCQREREIESRYTHGAKTLCDHCAALPHRLPSARGLEPRRAKRLHKSPRVDWQEVFDRMQELGLAPVRIGDYAVRCVCPSCGSPDPQYIWRSLMFLDRQGLVAGCDGGCSSRAISDALTQLYISRTSAHAA